MKYEYQKDLQASLKPGDRRWACGLRLNPAMTRYVRNMTPTFVELCVWKDPATEAASRLSGRPVQAVVPVRDDGTLDWNRAAGTSDLHFYDNRIQCVSRYDGLISELSTAIDDKIARMRARQSDMLARRPSYDDPERLAWETAERNTNRNE